MKPILLLTLCGVLYAQMPSDRSDTPSTDIADDLPTGITAPFSGMPNDTKLEPAKSDPEPELEPEPESKQVPTRSELELEPVPEPSASEPQANTTNPSAPTNRTRTSPGSNNTISNNGTTNGNNTNKNGTITGPKPRGSCAAFCKRREIRNLSNAERNAFFSAVKKLMSGPAPTKYDELVKKHLDATQHAHNTAYFLPWHRGYVREFEKALQAVDPNICVPYWNWSVDSQAPENSPVFTNDYYGTGGECVEDGQFKGWKPHYPKPHCLTRKWRYGDNLGAFHSFEGINKIVTGSDSYDKFRTRCEMIAHPAPHVNIGGDMAEMHSPNDPLFWAHHAYMDYVWVQHQKRKGFEFSGPNEKGGRAEKGDDLLGLPYKVEAVLDTYKLCYDYVDIGDKDLGDATLPPSTVPKPPSGQKPDKVVVDKVPTNDDERYSSKDRSNLNIVRYPDDADEEWCKRNKYDLKALREYESEYKQMYKKVNEIKGYVSPCSLWKRPALCAPLIKQKKELCVDVKDYGRIKVDYSSDVDPLQAYSNVKKRAEYCSPDVEYPEEKYRKEVENVVGKSAFGGAGTLKKVNNEEDISGASQQRNQLAGLCLAAILSVIFNAL